MKKTVLCFIPLLLLVALLCGCAPKTKYENMQIAKIETSIFFGEVMIYYHPVRTFDFETGTIIDTATMDNAQLQRLLDDYNAYPEEYTEYENVEAYESYLQSYYNTSEQVGSFTKEEADAFLEKVISFGIYTWEEKYTEDSYTCGSWHYVKIFFTDGTVKATGFYDVRPKNYTEIGYAFQDYFDVGMYCEK